MLKLATVAPTTSYATLESLIVALGGFGDQQTRALKNVRFKVVGAVSVRISTPAKSSSDGDDDLSNLLTADDPYIYADEIETNSVWVKGIGATATLEIRGDA